MAGLSNSYWQDIDLVVSPDEESWEEFDPEDIMYCRLPGWTSDHTRLVKVDILVPPTLNLPAIDASETCLFDDVPVMPLFDLLVMKTQGWWDHRISDRADFHAKEQADVSDIFALLDCAKQQNVSYVDEANESRHSSNFLGLARTLTKNFVGVYGRPGRWRALGFTV